MTPMLTERSQSDAFDDSQILVTLSREAIYRRSYCRIPVDDEHRDSLPDVLNFVPPSSIPCPSDLGMAARR